MIVEDALCFHFQLREENTKLTIKILTGTSQVTCALIHISFPFWKQYWLIKTYFSSLPWSITHMISSNHMLHEPLGKNFFNPVKVQTFSISACSKKQAQKGTMPPNVDKTNQIVEGNDKSKSILYTSHSSSTNFQKPLAHNYVSRQSQCIHCREAKCIPPSYNSILFPPFPYSYYALYSSHRLTLFELNIKKSKRDRNTKKRRKEKFS